MYLAACIPVETESSVRLLTKEKWIHRALRRLESEERLARHFFVLHFCEDPLPLHGLGGPEGMSEFSTMIMFLPECDAVATSCAVLSQ